MKISRISNQDLNVIIKIFLLVNLIVFFFFIANLKSDKSLQRYQNNIDIKDSIVKSLEFPKNITNKKTKSELEFSRSFLKEKIYSNRVELEVLVDTLAPFSLHSIYLNNPKEVKQVEINQQSITFQKDIKKIYIPKKVFRHKSYNQNELRPIQIKIYGINFKVTDIGLFNDFNDKRIETERFKSSIRSDVKVEKWSDKIFKSGTYKITKNIVVPKNTNIQFIGNVIFKMSENTSIESRSLFDLSQGRLKIIPQKKRWGSLSFHKVQGEISNISIDFARGGYTQNSYYDCALCFYQSTINLKNIKISNSSVEDSLYAIKSVVRLSNSTILNGSSDGFDCDFCDLKISNSSFINNKGDGLDLSGTKFDIKKSRFMQSVDKGISIGEESSGVVENSFFEQNKIAAAIKDGSIARMLRNDFVNNQSNIESYIKKNIYSSPRVVYE